MKKEKEQLFPSELDSATGFDYQQEYFNYSQAGTYGVYDHQFEEEYENYNSDYDLNTK